jgi:hypothetical protein
MNVNLTSGSMLILPIQFPMMLISYFNAQKMLISCLVFLEVPSWMIFPVLLIIITLVVVAIKEYKLSLELWYMP